MFDDEQTSIDPAQSTRRCGWKRYSIPKRIKKKQQLNFRSGRVGVCVRTGSCICAYLIKKVLCGQSMVDLPHDP